MTTRTDHKDSQNSLQKIRLDKWLWAARFFKTRSLAKQAIEGGKVLCEGSRCKSSREIEVGSKLQITQGQDEKTVIVQSLSDKRQGAPIAALLYAETDESVEKRELIRAQRKAMHTSNPHPDRRPSKQDRRRIHRLKQNAADFYE